MRAAGAQVAWGKPVTQHRDENRKRRSKVLCRISDGESALYAALAEITRPKATTVSDLLDSFMIHGLKELAPTTQESYRGYINRQLKPLFGDMQPDDIEPYHIAQYLEKRKGKAWTSYWISRVRSRWLLVAAVGWDVRCRLLSRRAVPMWW